MRGDELSVKEGFETLPGRAVLHGADAERRSDRDIERCLQPQWVAAAVPAMSIKPEPQMACKAVPAVVLM